MMDYRQSGLRWRVTGASVRGYSHERLRLPNQDAIRWRPDAGAGEALLVALSDGHGSAKSFRSAVGSKLAVELAVALISEGNDFPNLPNPSAIKRLAEDQIPRGLVRSWRKAVQTHFDQNPFTEEERELLKQRVGETGLNDMDTNPLMVYGATLLLTLVTCEFALHLQIGDGDILVVDGEGNVCKPVPSDNRLMANETTSLCAENAWKDFRLAFSMHLNSPPRLIMLSTDGYSNSFATEEGFLKIGTDIASMISDGKWEDVSKNMRKWLEDASREGSGDDITLGIIAPVESSA
jgi:serine/threonine protein phosphatase PrpC